MSVIKQTCRTIKNDLVFKQNGTCLSWFWGEIWLVYPHQHAFHSFFVFISWGATSNMRNSRDCDSVSFWKLAGLQGVGCDLSSVRSKTMWLFLGDTSGSVAFQRASPLWESARALKTRERLRSLGWEENKANAEQDVWLYLALTSNNLNIRCFH